MSSPVIGSLVYNQIGFSLTYVTFGSLLAPSVFLVCGLKEPSTADDLTTDKTDDTVQLVVSRSVFGSQDSSLKFIRAKKQRLTYT